MRVERSSPKLRSPRQIRKDDMRLKDSIIRQNFNTAIYALEVYMDDDNVTYLKPEHKDMEIEVSVVMPNEEALESIVLDLEDDGSISIMTTADWKETISIMEDALASIRDNADSE